jgi:hypothetical protein
MKKMIYSNVSSSMLINYSNYCLIILLLLSNNSKVRHLLVREKATGHMVGLISVKDIVKCTISKHDAVVNRLTGFVVNSESMRRDI